MPTPPRPQSGRPFLRVESLEDRLTPSYNPALPLDGQIASGDIMGDRLIVALRPGVSPAAAGLTAVAGTTQVKSIGFDMYSVRLAAGTSLDTARAALAARPGVDFAEADPIVRSTRLPNDTEYGQLYGMAKTGAQLTWGKATGNPNFVVAVIDTGVDYTHPDLAANMWTNKGETPGNGIDDDGNGYVDDVHGYDFFDDDGDPMDENDQEFDAEGLPVFHGTHCAGTIGAGGNNGLGVAGVNWNTSIMALRFLGPAGFGSISGAIGAINYSVQMGVKVTSNSWGGAFSSAALDQAIAGTRAAGQIFVVAAGNDGVDNDRATYSPANASRRFDNVVTVAATDKDDNLAGFSQYGRNSVTLGAPGVKIYSTLGGGGYHYLDGTSMATPHVAGAVTLYWGANPTLTYQQVVDKLKASVDKVPSLASKTVTGGRLNVARMFDISLGNPVVVGAPAGSEVVRVLGVDGVTEQNLVPHPGFTGGIVGAAGDITGDGEPDTVTAATFGGHVKVFDGATGGLIRSFYAFPGYQGPISVSIGDLTGDGIGDIIVAANLNGHVKVFDGTTGALTFSALAYQGYRGAVSVAAADMDGDGRNELLTAADGGAGVHIKAYTAGTLRLRESFIATDPSPKQWGGNFSLAVADLDGDDIAELMVSTGPRVRVIDAKTKDAKADFIAFDPLSADKVSVQAGRFKGDILPELVLVRQSGSSSQVRVYDGPNFSLDDAFLAGSR